MPEPRMKLSATVLGTRDPQGLCAFYAKLLGWQITQSDPDWAMLKPPDGGSGLSFQIETTHVPPTWPQDKDHQQMQMHLDIGVDDFESAINWSLENGARQADFQPQHDVRVMIDPAGHPFCLFRSEH
jgi:hypothetical protein